MTQYDDIIITPVYQPLTKPNYPGVVPHSGLGVMTGRPTPMQFFPSQQPPYSDYNVNARKAYRDAYGHSTGNINVATKKKFIGNSGCTMASSLRTERLKSVAVGKYSYNIDRGNDAPLSTKAYFPTEVRTRLQRCRNGGCVAPAKQGSIYNRSYTPLSPGWGNIGVNTTY
jgi:hypothetical protein